MKLFTIGCSFTEGQGLKNQRFESYSHHLSKKLNLEYFNFGVSGASNDYIFRKIFELINSNTIKKDDIIVIQWTHYNRKELFTTYKDREWYHYVPNSYHAYNDMIIKNHNDVLMAVNKYIDINLDEDRHNLESENKEILENYVLKFVDNDYQTITTQNYINSLYTYLEHFGFKHIHFFGWDNCIIESVFENKSNFLKETFGKYTKTNTSGKYPEHPNKKGHLMWSEFLFEKVKELNYLDTFETQLNNYKKSLYTLHVEIEKNIEDANQKIIKEKRIKLDKELEKIKEEKELKLQLLLEEERIEMEKFKNKVRKNLI